MVFPGCAALLSKKRPFYRAKMKKRASKPKLALLGCACTHQFSANGSADARDGQIRTLSPLHGLAARFICSYFDISCGKQYNT